VLPLSTSERGQTEPIAALVAVSAVALALSVYGVGVMQLLDQDSDRDIEDQTLDNVWDNIRDDGVYDASNDLENEIDPRRVLPRGYNVRVVVLLPEDGQMEPVDSADYNTSSMAVTRSGKPPDYAQTITRPIPVQVSPGETYTGTLRVTVWDES
jgi:hypothetical protein